jgi:hypothetical protein
MKTINEFTEIFEEISSADSQAIRGSIAVPIPLAVASIACEILGS